MRKIPLMSRSCMCVGGFPSFQRCCDGLHPSCLHHGQGVMVVGVAGVATIIPHAQVDIIPVPPGRRRKLPISCMPTHLPSSSSSVPRGNRDDEPATCLGSSQSGKGPTVRPKPHHCYRLLLPPAAKVHSMPVVAYALDVRASSGRTRGVILPRLPFRTGMGASAV